MNRAFTVDLGRYESPDEAYRGREGPIHLPDDLAGIVEGIFGLDNRRASRPHAITTTPTQVAGLYSFPSGKATGQTIGIIEFGGGFATSDINTFLTGLGLTTPTLNVVPVDGVGNIPAGNVNNVWTNNPTQSFLSDPDIEVTLDIDVAAAVAQGAGITVYFAPNTAQGWVDALSTALADVTNNPSVLSISWGADEATWTKSGITNVQHAFQSAAALGVTVFATSGDIGSNDAVNDGKAHVQYPASDPWVTTCGGTLITNLSPYTEGTWNDALGATGGGVSSIFGLPPYQAGAGVPPSVNDGVTIGRGVPDIAGNASGNSGYNLVLYGTQTNALKITNGKFAGLNVGTVAGTSAVAPLYAGMAAILNANLERRIGVLTPALYLIGKTSWLNVFRDIADGVSNGVSFTTAAGVSGTSLGYSAGPGWDPCTGWGIVNATALQNALIQGAVINNVDSTPDAPTVCIGFKGADQAIQLFWRANDSSNAIYTAVSGNGINFSPGFKINNFNSTPESPAACQFNGKVFVFWQANDPSNAIYFSNSADGVNFSKGQKISTVDCTQDSPVACVFLQHIFLYWKANDSSNAIYVTSSLDGVNWPPVGKKINSLDRTPEAPTACVLNDKIFLFWKANDPSNAIYVSASTDGSTFPQGRKINGFDATPESPSACVVNNRIFLFWKANDGSNSIYWSVSSDGVRWPQGQKIDYLDHTPDSPAPVVFENNLFLYWQADDDSNQIYGVGWPFSVFK
jgi:kumamolisin